MAKSLVKFAVVWMGILALATSLAGQTAQAAPTNAGFEAGFFTFPNGLEDWTVAGQVEPSLGLGGNGGLIAPFEGDVFALFNFDNNFDGPLSQNRLSQIFLVEGSALEFY